MEDWTKDIRIPFRDILVKNMNLRLNRLHAVSNVYILFRPILQQSNGLLYTYAFNIVDRSFEVIILPNKLVDETLGKKVQVN